ncbi:cyanase [Paraburkholderia fungorum]
MKAPVHQQPGECIISAINFKLEIRSIDDPEGWQARRRLLNGKYQHAKLF